MFYFLYSFYKYPNIDLHFLQLYQKKNCTFQLPEILELRKNFEGMNNFLFSNAFSDLLMSVLIEWYQDSIPKFSRVMDNLLITAMSLCLMFKVSLTHNFNFGLQKTIDLIFGIREDLCDLNVITFLVNLKVKLNHAVFTSVIDYLVKLSQIPPEYFIDLSQNLSDFEKES
ncbi:hypothetical protein RF11_12715 [Thelohanellus kitauei]|uniref:Uncharacterized protein n=1 Tax=Thelohanellus kitauei TaxID=669202 RepID=A0A0C2MHW6_THEKT|nr:hypothetical protein RF11_12715 [Thelohanellus kitauei]